MPDDKKVPTWRLFCGAGLVILGSIGSIIPGMYALMDLLPPHRYPLARIAVGYAASVLVIVAAAFTLHERSLVWQKLLQSAAVAGVCTGGALIAASLLHDWHHLLGVSGVIAIGCLALSVTAVILLRSGQRLRKRRHQSGRPL